MAIVPTRCWFGEQRGGFACAQEETAHLAASFNPTVTALRRYVISVTQYPRGSGISHPRSKAAMVEELAPVLDTEAAPFVIKLWRMLIYEVLKAKGAAAQAKAK